MSIKISYSDKDIGFGLGLVKNFPGENPPGEKFGLVSFVPMKNYPW